MGLDLYPASGSGRSSVSMAYSHFHEIRVKLARSAGIGTRRAVIPLGHGLGVETIEVWNPPADDEPLRFLLRHSDYDGDLSPSHCRLLAARIRELATKWSDQDGDKALCVEMAALMDDCARRHVRLGVRLTNMSERCRVCGAFMLLLWRSARFYHWRCPRCGSWSVTPSAARC